MTKEKNKTIKFQNGKFSVETKEIDTSIEAEGEVVYESKLLKVKETENGKSYTFGKK